MIAAQWILFSLSSPQVRKLVEDILRRFQDILIGRIALLYRTKYLTAWAPDEVSSWQVSSMQVGDGATAQT